MLSLIFHHESHGRKTSKLYRKFNLLLNCSKMGRVNVVWWMRVVDSHPVINNSIAITITTTNKILRQLCISLNGCHFNYTPVR